MVRSLTFEFPGKKLSANYTLMGYFINGKIYAKVYLDYGMWIRIYIIRHR